MTDTVFETKETEYVREGAVNLPPNATGRDLVQRAVVLRKKLDYDLGHNLMGRSMRVGRVAIIAAANSASFGWSLARGILQAHPENSVVVTGRENKKIKQAERNAAREIKRNPGVEGRIDVIKYDVTNPTLIGEQGELDNVVIAAAYIPQAALSLGIKAVSDVSPVVLQQGRDVVVDGFKRTTEVLAPTLVKGGGVYGVTFAGHTLPGYVAMGQLKAELEEAVLDGDLTETGIGQGIFSLGAYESAASLAIDGFSDGSMTRGLYERLGIQNPTMREMVWPAIAAMADENLHRELIHLDGGLRKALTTEEGGAAYETYLAEITSTEQPD